MGYLIPKEAVMNDLFKSIDKEDYFNSIKQLTLINKSTGNVIFQIAGRLSVYITDDKVKVSVKDKGSYIEHLIRLNDNISCKYENLDVEDVENFRYTLSFSPDMWLPVL